MIQTYADILKLIKVPKKMIFAYQEHANKLKLNVKNETGFYFYGPTGTGKTTLAIYAMMEMLKPEIMPIEFYQSITDPTSEMFDSNYKPSFDACFISLPYMFSQNIKEQDKQMKQAIETGIVILDDLGGEATTEWVYQRLYTIISERYNHERKTIITSNLSLDQLDEKLNDPRLVSRIVEMCRAVKVTGKDKRRARR